MTGAAGAGGEPGPPDWKAFSTMRRANGMALPGVPAASARAAAAAWAARSASPVPSR